MGVRVVFFVVGFVVWIVFVVVGGIAIVALSLLHLVENHNTQKSQGCSYPKTMVESDAIIIGPHNSDPSHHWKEGKNICGAGRKRRHGLYSIIIRKFDRHYTGGYTK